MIRSSRKLFTFCCVITQILALAFALQLVAAPAAAQQFDEKLYSGMQWRLIGPFRAGRVTVVAGIPGDATTYYMGTPGGGVWKTTDGGIVWKPIFDDTHVASIGALALAPSDPNIIYVATGEQTDGNGVYKSTDAGKTWANIGLRDAKTLSSIVVDPQNPNVVLVGVSGGQQPSSVRGVYRTPDGGKNWERVLFIDDRTGLTDLVTDPNDHKVLYAAMWRIPEPPTPKTTEKKEDRSGVYKSTDQGKNWKRLSGGELPASQMGRIGLVVAPGKKGRRVFAIMDQGLFRSDDAGASWQRITTDPRIVGNWYFSRIFTDPKNPDIVYVMQTSLYRSTDGGKTFAAFRGAPGGDDYHHMWIDPTNSQRIILGVDQGATISLDGGKTFSPWFNQSTGQFYHVTTDNQFPYVAYAEQQDSGTVAVPSRSDYGRISYRDWFSVGGFEFGYIAPDPQDSNLVYATGWFGTVVRFDKTTGQINTVFVPDKARSNQPPMQFSPQDKHTLYIGTHLILKTSDGGMAWKEISPDLTAKGVKSSETGKSDGKEDKDKGGEEEESPAAARNRRITALSLSPAQEGLIWAGTSNGLVQLTRDAGATWTNATPGGLPKETTIIMIESSHYDAATAYMVTKPRNDDHPYFYRTHDAGKSWQLIARGLPDSTFARVIREDPVRKQLLYAGTENAVYVSFNDGDDWNSLQLNLPTASVRDLAIHGNDLVAATFGRALWVLDDLSPLRQFAPEVTSSEAYFFRPAQALRWRWDNNQETPLPPEVPTGDNPPDGAILDYYLKSVPASEIALTISDSQGNVVQRYSSKAEPAKDDMPKNVPDYWLAPPAVLPVKQGLNRFVWNLRYPAPPALRYGYFGEKLAYQEFTLTNGAVPGHTSGEMVPGPLAVPGQYEAVLNVNGKTYRQAITIAMDPRVKASQSDLVEQFKLQRQVDDALAETVARYNDVAAMKKEVSERQKALEQNSGAKDANDALQKFAKNLDSLQTGNGDAPGYGVLNRELARLALMLEEGDAQPTAPMVAAAQDKLASLERVQAQWQKVKAEQVASLNSLLQKYQVAGLE